MHSSLSSRPVGGLPLFPGGSTSAITVSRPARRSLAFRPAWSLSRPRRPFSPKCFSPCRYLHEPLWLLPAGATVAGWASHPPGKRAFPRRTVNSTIHFVMSTLHPGRPTRDRRGASPAEPTTRAQPQNAGGAGRLLGHGSAAVAHVARPRTGRDQHRLVPLSEIKSGRLRLAFDHGRLVSDALGSHAAFPVRRMGI